jgi:hypothetical protein
MVGAATVVPVTLQDGAVVLGVSPITEGPVELEISNAGPEHAHELVVVRTDLPADGLPTLDDGSFDESAEGVEVVVRTDPVEVGGSTTLAVHLVAGHHVFLCNDVGDVDGEPSAHYAAGMRTDVEVVDAATTPLATDRPAASPAASVAPGSVELMPTDAPTS